MHPVAVVSGCTPVYRFRLGLEGTRKATALHVFGCLFNSCQFENGRSKVGVIDQPVVERGRLDQFWGMNNKWHAERLLIDPAFIHQIMFPKEEALITGVDNYCIFQFSSFF